MEIIGRGKIKELKKIIHKNEYERVLLVTNRNSFTSTGLDEKLKPLLSECEYERFYDFNVNPTFEDLLNGIKITKKMKPDLIIGIGGGSAMDLAKLLAVHHNKVNMEFSELYEFSKSPIDTLLVPTTSGSGSEATKYAVISYQNSKTSVADKRLIPKYCIVDGSLTDKLPPSVTAYTGLDAISQALESYWSNNATDESKQYALKAIELMAPNLVKAFKGNDPNARDKMAHGSFLAGKAIDISATTAPHAFSYFLTDKYQVPHGQAVALIVPFFIRVNSKAVDLQEVLDLFDFKSVNELEDFYNTMLKDMGLYKKIEDIVDNKMEFINAVNESKLINNPVQLTGQEYYSLFFEE
tara:strand:+ start:185173 stop:186231 length:1059 start_codon:yes stop_codon:yes gene_type:complete